MGCLLKKDGLFNISVMGGLLSSCPSIMSLSQLSPTKIYTLIPWYVGYHERVCPELVFYMLQLKKSGVKTDFYVHVVS